MRDKITVYSYFTDNEPFAIKLLGVGFESKEKAIAFLDQLSELMNQVFGDSHSCIEIIDHEEPVSN